MLATECTRRDETRTPSTQERLPVDACDCAYLRKSYYKAGLDFDADLWIKITEAALIITQIFTSNGPLATKDSNIYALSSTLLWAVLIAPFVSEEPPKWWPFYSTWICALATETLMFGCLVSFVRPSNPLERGQLAVKIIRIVFLIVLPASYFFFSAIDQGIMANDEESAPLLGHDEVRPEDSPKSGYGSTTNNTKTSSASCSDDEEAEVEESKERAEKLKKLQDRVRENGNWFTYLKEFTASRPPFCIRYERT